MWSRCSRSGGDFTKGHCPSYSPTCPPPPAQERSAILGALQREVARVHRQLALAAAELKPKGPAGGLAALSSWDVAYSQV
jgi:hypothetical protein